MSQSFELCFSGNPGGQRKFFDIVPTMTLLRMANKKYRQIRFCDHKNTHFTPLQVVHAQKDRFHPSFMLSDNLSFLRITNENCVNTPLNCVLWPKILLLGT